MLGLRPVEHAFGRAQPPATVPWHGKDAPLRDVAARATAIAREHALEEVERMLRDGNGGDRMRAAYAAGGMPGVLGLLVEETAVA
jgi:carboxylate-amine ligase